MSTNIKLKDKQIKLAQQKLKEIGVDVCKRCECSDFDWEMDLNFITPHIITDGGTKRKMKPIVNMVCKKCGSVMSFDAISLLGKENLFF